MENIPENAENKEEMKSYRNKKKILVTTIGTVVVLAAAGCTITAYLLRQPDDEQETGQDQMRSTAGGFGQGIQQVVTASGTTSVGVDAVTFDIDFLEDTTLYVEEVYLSSGDIVEAGTQYLKLTEDSIKEARNELESAAKEAELAYRSAVISTNESKIQAKYSYEQTLLEASQAQQVYEDTLASLQAQLDSAQQAYEEALAEYQELYDAVVNNTLYEDYEIEAKKQAYEEAYDLYTNRVAYWEVTDSELESGSSSGSGSAGAQTVSTQEVSTEQSSDAAQQEGMADGGAGAEDGEEMGSGSVQQSSSSSKGVSQEEAAAKADRQWILKTVQLLQEEMEESLEEYEEAKESYQDAIEHAELNLKKLLNAQESAAENYQAAQLTYETQCLNAKITYETALVKGKTAASDYETTLTSLNEALEQLADAKEEAQENLALFEETIGDGYFYIQEAGTIMMARIREGETLSGGSMLFAYSNPDKISVSVSVSQDTIAQLSVGQSATVIITDYGTYTGTVTSINPTAASDSRTSVTYTVEIALEGDVSELSANLTATVMFEIADTAGGQSNE